VRLPSRPKLRSEAWIGSSLQGRGLRISYSNANFMRNSAAGDRRPEP